MSNSSGMWKLATKTSESTAPVNMWRLTSEGPVMCMLASRTLHLSSAVCECKKLNKLDDSKNSSILKKRNRDQKWKNYGNKSENKKVWKQVKEWKQAKVGAQGLLYVE